jgi:hypothetical protein
MLVVKCNDNLDSKPFCDTINLIAKSRLNLYSDPCCTTLFLHVFAKYPILITTKDHPLLRACTIFEKEYACKEQLVFSPSKR